MGMGRGYRREREVELYPNASRSWLKSVTMIAGDRRFQISELFPFFRRHSQNAAGEIAELCPIRLFHHATLHTYR